MTIARHEQQPSGHKEEGGQFACPFLCRKDSLKWAHDADRAHEYGTRGNMSGPGPGLASIPVPDDMPLRQGFRPVLNKP